MKPTDLLTHHANTWHAATYHQFLDWQMAWSGGE